ncbi:hypothetical protein [Metamycoplasma hyosynoviae]|uniref:hypothetical protein n=1 Tax=Metamycoplasma hyosynoviae TaxID=29559 RepID=UPI000B0666A0|nr:hypothetical protein [Metamycoplasma hyosynoviae]MDC8900401.1 hypothetical protein [Metamycoplasma hyosynoviae]MDC8917402.1 hypothetical protein [Metamycoplasma hyosynoviae]MDC8920551.1 hypothetical protein [Metamycoplasma hyosynoviae]MDD1366397.1 hypothetical protein [Metamycoplasma hyosynoviae]MDD1373919.1 hypothetical protein [Metamycoplasma hyosynoviae]
MKKQDNNEPIIPVCIVCNKKLPVKESKHIWNEVRLCSQKCWKEFRTYCQEYEV